MLKRPIIIFSIIMLLVIGFFVLNSFIYNQKQVEESAQDFKNVTFTISGVPVTLKNGTAEVVTDLGGASKTIVRYFGNELVHTIDDDGAEDVVFLVIQETGGSGTFFYVVGALKRSGGYIGTKAMYLGDRIAPQTIEKGEGRMVIVNYADRAPGEPMTARPSVGKSMRILLDTKTLEFGEVAQNFEGEGR